MTDLMTVENIVSGLIMLVLGMLSALGIYGKQREARKAKPTEEGETVQLAGALIDSRKANELMAAIDRLCSHLQRCADATERSASEVSEASSEIRVLTTEIVRNASK